MASSERPLSPHLQIYRWPLAMAISIFHRITGIILAAGAVLSVVVLVSVAAGPDTYEIMRGYIAGKSCQVFLLFWAASLFLHLFNGIRHLVWDAGYGFGKAATRYSGILVILATVVLTAAVWWVAWLTRSS